MFYGELQEWRATAVQCGLDVPEIGILLSCVYICFTEPRSL